MTSHTGYSMALLLFKWGHIMHQNCVTNANDHRPNTLVLYSYRKTSNISRTLAGNKIVDNSDVVGASPVGPAPTTSSFST